MDYGELDFQWREKTPEPAAPCAPEQTEYATIVFPGRRASADSPQGPWPLRTEDGHCSWPLWTHQLGRSPSDPLPRARAGRVPPRRVVRGEGWATEGSSPAQGPPGTCQHPPALPGSPFKACSNPGAGSITVPMGKGEPHQGTPGPALDCDAWSHPYTHPLPPRDPWGLRLAVAQSVDPAWVP